MKLVRFSVIEYYRYIGRCIWGPGNLCGTKLMNMSFVFIKQNQSHITHFVIFLRNRLEILPAFQFNHVRAENNSNRWAKVTEIIESNIRHIWHWKEHRSESINVISLRKNTIDRNVKNCVHHNNIDETFHCFRHTFGKKLHFSIKFNYNFNVFHQFSLVSSKPAIMSAVSLADFDAICRSCLCRTGEMRPIFGSSLDDMLRDVTNIQVSSVVFYREVFYRKVFYIQIVATFLLSPGKMWRWYAGNDVCTMRFTSESSVYISSEVSTFRWDAAITACRQ